MDATVECKILSSLESVPDPIFNIQSRFEDEVSDEKKMYFGLAATTFKERLGNHKKDFDRKQHSKNAELSKIIW